MARSPRQLELASVVAPTPVRGGRRKGAGRKPANPNARPNASRRARPAHNGRHPVHVTMRARGGLPSFRTEVVRTLFKQLLWKQRKRAYASEFQVVHFSIQRDHIHLIVEAAAKERTKGADREALRRGVSGLAISFARRLNRVLRRKGKVWGDRHHRRDLESPTDVRNTLLYVLQNHRRHGVKALAPGMLDPYSTAVRFRPWARLHAAIIETEPWPDPTPRTWLLGTGWLRGGGPLEPSDLPRAARIAQRVR